MSLFALSDLHLSLNCDKKMDIFNGWEGYVERLQKNWNNVVKEEDTVVVNGDISWAMKLEETREDFAFLNRLPGQKLLLKGNHDLWWSTMNKMENYIAENGFDRLKLIHNNAAPVGSVCVCGTRGWFFDDGTDKKVLLREAGRLQTSLDAAFKTGLEPVVFLHYPPLYDGQVCHEIMEVLLQNHVRRCYYGHIHGRAAGKAIRAEYGGVQFRLVTCDSNGFCPVLIEPRKIEIFRLIICEKSVLDMAF